MSRERRTRSKNLVLDAAPSRAKKEGAKKDREQQSLNSVLEAK